MDERNGAGPEPFPERPQIGPPPPRQTPGAALTSRPAPAAPAGPPPAGAASNAPPAPTDRRRRRPLLLVAAAVVVLVVGGAVALVVRGGGGSSFTAVPLGTATGPLSEPGDEAWSVPLPEEGLATVIGGEDVVLVTEDAVHVSALDAGDGEELWTAELEGGDFNRAVPLKGGGVLLETEPEQYEPLTRLVDARTGEERWEAEGAIPSIYRDHTSPDATAIHDLDVVLLQGDEAMVGVDRETGEVRWEVDEMSDGGACAGLLVLTTDGTGEPYSMVAVDPTTGDEVWSADGRVGQCRDGQVAVTDDATVTVHDAADGSTVGELELDDDPGQLIATPLGEHLLVQGADRDTGATFVMVVPSDGGRPIVERDGVLATPVGDGSVLFLTPTASVGGGTFVRVDDGEELATTEIDTSRDNDCFLGFTRERILLCDDLGPEVVALDVADGSEAWSLDTGAAGEVLAVGVVGDRLVVATRDEVTAYRA